MSAPVVTGSTNAGNVSIQSNFDHTTQDVDRITKHRYTRTFEHYCSNAMDAFGYSEDVSNGYINKWMVDEGWQIIPYWNPAVAMTVRDCVHLGAEAAAIKVTKLGFKIVHAQIMRQEIVAPGGTTTINNSFASQPYFETFCDTLHFHDPNVAVRPSDNVS